MRHLHRVTGVAVLGAALGMVIGGPSASEARFSQGGVSISGNIEMQNIFRFREIDSVQPIQQRNTLRLEYDHELLDPSGMLLEKFDLSGLFNRVHFFAYYRFVYDSIYAIGPGGFLRAQDGSLEHRHIGSVESGHPNDVAIENVIREIYVDLSMSKLPVRFRIGRQQIVWGNTVNFRALDSVHSLDLTWHWTQEAGILGRVGFTELRRPAWAIRMITNLGNFGPISNVYVDAYDIPFDYNQTKLRFLPAPWSAPVRDPFRGGLVVDAGEALGAPPGTVLLQPCFDMTGRVETNAEANPDFSDTAETGKCHAEGFPVTSFTQGLYDRRDPFDANQVGVRIGGTAPRQINFTLNYMYRRSIFDVSGTASAKLQQGLTAGTGVVDYVELAPHTTFDESTAESTDVAGYLRIPIEFYQPYVHVFGFSLDYFEEFTGSVLNGEFAWTHDNPVQSRGAFNGVRKTDMVFAALNMDKPFWFRPLNKGRTFDFTFQTNFAWLPFHEDIEFDAEGNVIDGDVGSPFSTTIPRQFHDEPSFDRLKGLEILTVMVVNTTYWGGTLIPAVAWISDWTTAPTMEWLFILQYLPTPYIQIEPQARIFWTNGRTTHDRFSIGRMDGRNELVLKFVYQF